MPDYFVPWRVRDAEGREHPAFLKVGLGPADQADVQRLLDEYRREAAAGGDPGDVMAWLAARGVPAEIVPIGPGTL